MDCVDRERLDLLTNALYRALRKNIPISPMGNSVGCPVMKASQEFEFFDWQFVGRNSQLVIQLADGSVLDTHYGSIGKVARSVNLGRYHAMKWMRTARVCPYIWESNLGGRTLLEQKFTSRLIKEED